MDFLLEEEMVDIVTFCLQYPNSQDVLEKRKGLQKLEKNFLLMVELMQWRISFL